MKIFNIFNLIDFNNNIKRNKNSHIKTNNICIIISDILRDFGGLEKTLVNLSNYLCKFYNIFVFIKKQKKQINISSIFDDKIKIIYFTGDLSLYNVIKIRDVILDINPDCLLSCYSWNEAILWPIVLMNTGIPLFYSEHNNPTLIKQRWNKNDRIEVFKCSDKIRLQLEDFKEYEEFNEKTIIINNGINLTNKKPIKNIHKNIVYVGKINENIKQTNILLDNFIKLNKDDWNLILYGSIETKTFEKYMNKKNIFFEGFCKDLDKIYNNKSFLCIPSKYEGFPNVVLEALSYNIPVLGFSNCSGVNSLIKNNVNGLLCEDMFVGLKFLTENINIISKLSTNCYNSIVEYNLQNIHELWYNTIKEIICKKDNTCIDYIIKEKYIIC